ncbi:hypothetical protein DUNSADRAFT_7068 [Dunaliella salina]|uniref:Uncharacterized protein n=1 Tax=Dunaliella salina TaxID=3046 RepID=A0ABQ7H6H5_DUNSA|nr:hypothetical protein DUNSADRAFT_7068 [Dunaliella salina]|eukprot:KAF5842459.1 hypothetical protein DUNSADRAFT_7068 [Dunaliella salina]
MFLDGQGQLRLDHMWELPTQLEVLALGLAPSGDRFYLRPGTRRQSALSTRHSQLSRANSALSVGLLSGQPSRDNLPEESAKLESCEASMADFSEADLESPRAALGRGRKKLVLKLEPLDSHTKHHLVLGIQVAQLMWLHVRAALFQALLLAPSAQLAHGGDASFITNTLPYVPEEEPLAATLLEPKQWKKKLRSSKRAGGNRSFNAKRTEGGKAGRTTTLNKGLSKAPSSELGPDNIPAEGTWGMQGEDDPVRGGATASNWHAAANKSRDPDRRPGGIEEQESSRSGGAAEGTRTREEGEGQWMQRKFLSGRQLLDHMGQVSASRMAPFLPGALLVSSLSGLRSRLAYLVQPQSKAKGKASTPAVASSVVPAPEAIQLLAREAGVHGMAAVVAVTRARDAFTMTPTRQAAWHLAGALEGTLARALVSPPSDQPNLMAMAMLRMRDAERVALHNELEHVQVVLERIVQEECGVSMVLYPGAAVSLAEYALEGIWAHDRLRDGLVWRAMLMEAPTQYPGVVPQESDFLRRYHDAPLSLLPVGPCQPVSPGVRAWMERAYEARVTGKAQALLASAANFAPPATAAPEAAAKFGQVPGHPAWIAQSPMWASREGRAVEAALCIIKQEVDMQAMQVALLRLHKDCAQLAGLAVRAPPPSAPALARTKLPESSPGVAALSPGASLSAPLQVMVRHLLARKQLASHQDGAGIMYEVCAEDMAAWLSEAVAAAAHVGLATAKAACHAAAQERSELAQLASRLTSQVSAAISDHGVHVRRHAIRVESHLVDRAMLLLQELAYVRRAAVHSQEDAASAYEVAYMAAQTQHATIIKELQNALMVAHSNTELLRADMQRATLDAMMEVRRETLQKAFGTSSLAPQRTTASSVRGGLPSGNSDEDSANGSEGSEEGDAAFLGPRPASPLKASSRPGSGRPMPAATSLPRSLVGQSHTGQPCTASLAASDTKPSRPNSSAQQGQMASKGGMGGGGGIIRILDLESQVEELQAEIIDMQRAIVKVQTWFKMRSGAFQAACMKEVVEGRARVTAVEGALWDLREAYELKLENASIQLRATQADLEVAVSSLDRSSTDLTHALSSNKRLLLWKVTQAPRVEAMRTQLMAKSISLSQGPPSTEAWLELMGSKDGVLGSVPLMQQLQEAEEDTAARQSPRKQQQQQQPQRDLQYPSDQGWLEERQALLNELTSLRRQLAAHEQHQLQPVPQTLQPLAPVSTSTGAGSSCANNDLSANRGAAGSHAHLVVSTNRKAAGGHAYSNGSTNLAGANSTADQGLHAAQGHEEGVIDVGDEVPLPGALDQEELQAAYSKAVVERSELQRVLEAVRAVAPDAVHAAEQGQQWAPACAGQPSAAPYVTSPAFTSQSSAAPFITSPGEVDDVPTVSTGNRPHSSRHTRPSTAMPISQPMPHTVQRQHQVQAGGRTPHSRSLSPHTFQAHTASSPSSTSPSLLHGPLSTFHSTSSATHPFTRSLHMTTQSPAALSSPRHANPASSSNSLRSARPRPRSAAAAIPAPLSKSFVGALPADVIYSTPQGGSTAPPSFSVAGPRHPHSAARPAMRLLAAASTSQPSQPSASHVSTSHPSTSHPSTLNPRPSTSHPSTKSSVGEADGAPSTAQSAAAWASGPRSHHLARQPPSSAVRHSREGASSPIPNPGSPHPHYLSVQTETPSLQVTASKLSMDPVPAAQSGAGSARTSVNHKAVAQSAAQSGAGSPQSAAQPAAQSGAGSTRTSAHPIPDAQSAAPPGVGDKLVAPSGAGNKPAAQSDACSAHNSVHYKFSAGRTKRGKQ